MPVAAGLAERGHRRSPDRSPLGSRFPLLKPGAAVSQSWSRQRWRPSSGYESVEAENLGAYLVTSLALVDPGPGRGRDHAHYRVPINLMGLTRRSVAPMMDLCSPPEGGGK